MPKSYQILIRIQTNLNMSQKKIKNKMDNKSKPKKKKSLNKKTLSFFKCLKNRGRLMVSHNICRGPL